MGINGHNYTEEEINILNEAGIKANEAGMSFKEYMEMSLHENISLEYSINALLLLINHK